MQRLLAVLAAFGTADAARPQGSLRRKLLSEPMKPAVASLLKLRKFVEHEDPESPAPGPAPGPEPLPLPPCNWTRNSEGIAKPMNCTTITENVASGAVEDGTLSINERMTVTCSDLDEFPSEEVCKSPLIVDCMNLPHLGMYKDYYTVMGNSHKNGAFRNISCAADAAPTDGKYPIDTWGEEWYEGPRLSNSSCNNGTWMYIKPVNMAVQKPEHLTCFTKEQIRLLKMMIHYYKSTMASLNATKKIPFKWIDSSAVERMDKLVHAQTNAKRMWDDALNGEMASVDDFKTVIAALIENAMIHRGEEFNQTTCDDFQNHMLYQLKHAGPQKFANYVPPQNASLEFPGYPTHEDVDLEPVLPLKCSWAVQKSSIGWDFMNARP